jgi:Tol biopolymer transport system component
MVATAFSSIAVAQVGATSRLSVSTGGTQGNAGSWAPAVEANGRYVTFQSHANNLVAGDTNGVVDVFVKDRSTGVTTRESTGVGGFEGNAISEAPIISGDGRYVVFQSNATNLVPNDFNGLTDCFVRDRLLGTTTRISLTWNGSEADSPCLNPWISTNGMYATFYSQATNLVQNDTNGVTDIFRVDLSTNEIARVSVSEAGVEGNGRSEFASTSGDGRYVVFHSGADNLAPGDTNGFWDVFVKDMTSGTVLIASVTSGGVQGNGHSAGAGMSEDGRFIVFSTDATNLDGVDTNGVKDSLIHDVKTGVTEKVSIGPGGVEGNGESIGPVVSSDGRIVAFSSMASNLVASDTNGKWDVLVRDRLAGTTTLASRSTEGVQGNGDSHGPVISANGIHVGFQALASNLVPDDSNNALDAFVHIRRAWVQPTTHSLFRGILVAGALGSLFYSDDSRMILRPGIVFSTVEAPIQLVLDSASPYGTTTSLEIEVEWHCTSANVRQEIQMWDFQRSAHVTVSTLQSPLVDTNVSVSLVPSENYVGPSGQLWGRIMYRAVGPVFAYPWEARIDRVRWVVTP